MNNLVIQIPNNTPYCDKCPYWRMHLHVEEDENCYISDYEGYCLYYKSWLLDNSVRLIRCVAEHGDNYEDNNEI